MREKDEILGEVKKLGALAAQSKADPSRQFKQAEIEILLDIRDALHRIAEKLDDTDVANQGSTVASEQATKDTIRELAFASPRTMEASL